MLYCDGIIGEPEDRTLLSNLKIGKGIRKGNNNTIHFSNAPSNQKILQKRDDIKFQRMVVKSGTK